MRGQAADYDHWRQLGLAGWGWDDVRPVFRRLDDHFLGDSEHHGAGGEWRVEAPRVRWAVLDAIAEAAVEMGVPATADFNTGDNTGVGLLPRQPEARPALVGGARLPEAGAEAAEPAARDRRAGRAGAVRGPRAVGVRFRQRRARRSRRARRGEVILAAGAIGSPQILQLSGVGPADWLARARHRRSCWTGRASARNLQDHLQQRAIYQGERRQDPERDLSLAARPRADGGRIRAVPARAADHGALAARHLHAAPSPEHERANIEFHVQPLSLDKFGEPLHRFPGDHGQRPATCGRPRAARSGCARPIPPTRR